MCRLPVGRQSIFLVFLKKSLCLGYDDTNNKLALSHKLYVIIIIIIIIIIIVTSVYVLFASHMGTYVDF